MVSNVLVHRNHEDSASKLERDEEKIPSNSSLISEPIEQVKLLDASVRGSVHSDSGISCTSSRQRAPRAETEIKAINKIYDSYETASIRSHATSRSNSTYRSGDISASVSTFKPFVLTNGSDIAAALDSEEENPFEKFVEVLISTHVPATKGKEHVPPGFQDDAQLWSIFTSSRLNLKIPPDQVRTMRDWFYAEEHSTQDLTAEFVSSVRNLITHLSRERPLYGPSWVAIMDHKSRELFFNRVTGEARYALPKDFPTLSDMDVFGRTIHEMFYSVTRRGTNHITLAQFDEICNSKKYNFDLQAEEKGNLLRSIVKTLNEEEVIYYEDFVPIGRALLLKWYRQQYPKGGDWLKLSSKRYGFFYLNKMTGETTFRPAQYEREQLSLYLQETLKEVETLKETVKFTEEECASAKDRLSRVTTECEEQGDAVSSLNERIEKLGDEIAGEKESYGKLLDKYDSTTQQLEEARNELTSSLEDAATLQQEKARLQEGVTDNLALVQQKQKSIESLVDETESLRDEIAKANAIANAKESEAAGLLYDYEGEKKAHENTEDEFKKSKKHLESEIKELQLKLSANESNNKTLLNTGGKLQSIIDAILIEKTGLELTVTELERELKEEKEKTKKLEETNETQENRNTMMDADLRTFKEQHLTSKNKEVSDALKLIEDLKAQLEYQREEVSTLKIKHASKTQVFAKQSEDVFQLKEQLGVLEDRDSKHAEVLKEAVLRAGRILRKAHCRENAPVSLTRVQSCPDLDQPFPSGATIEPTQKRRVKQCWNPATPPSRPQNICTVYSDCGDITLCTREREKVVIMRDQEKVQVKSLRAPRDDSYLQHTRPFSPTCTCHNCRRLMGESRPQSAKSVPDNDPNHVPGLPISVGDRVRCRTVRPGYRESRMCEGIIEFLGRRRGCGKALFVGVNLGVPLGDTDGSVEGERLFRCPAKQGIVVPLHNVLAYFSLKTQTFIPLMLSGQPEKEKTSAPRRRRPKSANNTITSNTKSLNNCFSTISVDERFVRSPYLQSLLAVDPYSPEFRAANGCFTKPRISRPIPRQKPKNRVYYN